MRDETARRIETLLFLAGSGLLAASLGLFAAAGSFARYWADDYCYSAWVRVFGLPGALLDWYNTSGNRLSTLAAVALSEAFGPAAIRFMALALLALWACAWWFFLWRSARLLGLRAAPLAWLWLALAQVYFVTLLAPDRLQTIYWRMGALHYSLPLPLLLINLGLLAWAAGREGRGAGWLAAAGGLLAFFAAGLSETFAALQSVLFGLGLAALVLWSRLRRRRGAPLGLAAERKLVALLAAPLAGSVLMMAVMANAPANAWRQESLPPPDNLLLIAPYSLRYALDFIFYTLRGRLVPFVVYLLGMAAFGLLALRAAQPQARNLAWGAAGSLACTYLLIASSFAPSALAGLAYPAGRAQMPAAFVLLVGIGLAAVLGALLLRRLLPGLPWRALALLALAACSLYPLRLAPIPRQEQAVLAERAARWDARDAQIRAALAGGLAAVTVRQTDVVQTLEDLGPDPRYWVNVCAAMYYGAESITAEP